MASKADGSHSFTTYTCTVYALTQQYVFIQLSYNTAVYTVHNIWPILYTTYSFPCNCCIYLRIFISTPVIYISLYISTLVCFLLLFARLVRCSTAFRCLGVLQHPSGAQENNLYLVSLHHKCKLSSEIFAPWTHPAVSVITAPSVLHFAQYR